MHELRSFLETEGLQVEGLYRRCGIAPNISKLVDALRVSPKGTVLKTDEMSILDVSGALKQILRQEVELIPHTHTPHWLKAAALSDETLRLQTYRRLLQQLPPDSHATLAALCRHLHTVQEHNQENRMTAYNLAVIFVVTLFQDLAMNTGMVQLTRELIMHNTEIFMTHAGTDEVVITVL